MLWTAKRALEFEIVEDDSTEMKWWEICNLLFALLSCSESEHCDADNAKCDASNDVVDCSRRIRLRDLGNKLTRDLIYYSIKFPYCHSHHTRNCMMKMAIQRLHLDLAVHLGINVMRCV